MKKFAFLFIAAIVAICNGCFSTSATRVLPSSDYLTQSEFIDTSYFASRPQEPFSSQYWEIHDARLKGVAIDSVYSRPLFDLDSIRTMDSLGQISPHAYQRRKHTITDAYTILKGTL